MTLSLNHETRRTWKALQRFTQKQVHDSNNVFGAIQGYISLLEMSPDINEQLGEYLRSMQEALNSGMMRNKALAHFYRKTEVMMIETDPVALAREAVNHFKVENGYDVTVHLPVDIPPLRLEEPVFSKLISHLCYLLQRAPCGEPVITFSAEYLTDVQLGEFVMESAPGDYMLLRVQVDSELLESDPSAFLEPFQMPISEDIILGMADILPIISNHAGNLDLQLEQELLTMSVYFPYKSA